MPLLKGKKNIGHNIETEEAHGKPHDQAVAIALRTAGVPKKGKDAVEKTAYRGYLLVPGSRDGKVWDVTKDGVRISTQPSLEKAKAVVDELHELGLAEDSVLAPVPVEGEDWNPDAGERGMFWGIEQEAKAKRRRAAARKAARTRKRNRSRGRDEDLAPVPVGDDREEEGFEHPDARWGAPREPRDWEDARDAKKELSVPDRHKLRVLRQLLKMPDAMIPFAGGGYNSRAEVEAELKSMLAKQSSKDASGDPDPVYGLTPVPMPAGERNEAAVAPRRRYEVDDEAFPRGASPREKAGLSKAEWNALPAEERRRLVSGASAKDAASPDWQPDSPAQWLLDKLHDEMIKLYNGRYRYSSSAGKGEIQHFYHTNQGTGVIAERKNGKHGVGFKSTDAINVSPIVKTVPVSKAKHAKDGAPEKLDIVEVYRGHSIWKVKTAGGAIRYMPQPQGGGVSGLYASPEELKAEIDRVNKMYYSGAKDSHDPSTDTFDREDAAWIKELHEDGKTVAEIKKITGFSEAEIRGAIAGKIRIEDSSVNPNADLPPRFKPGDHVYVINGPNRGVGVVRAVHIGGTVRPGYEIDFDGKKMGTVESNMFPAKDSDPLSRAQRLEIAGDKVRARDAYAAAAKSTSIDDVARAKARDGVEACKLNYDRYTHPESGRTRKYTDRGRALDAAVARTRSGERVRVRDSASGEYVVSPMESGAGAKDEHEGFAKLERSLAHRKGVEDPAALAAAIGRKKYGAAGMAKKVAAGRAKDEETVRQMRDRLFNVRDQKEPASRYYPREARPGETVEEMRHRLFAYEPQDAPFSKASSARGRDSILRRVEV